MATTVSSASSTTEHVAAASAPGRERAILATVALATTLAPLNSTMIAVALPAITRTFHTTLDSTGWLITAYLVVMAALQPVAGKLGDRLGRRPLLLGGLIYFGVVSVGAALAPNLPLLLLFRVQQAAAGAIALPNGAALVREVIPAERRASSFGIIGAITGLAAAVGPALGGLLTAAGWQAIFWVNVPLVAAALAFGWRVLPATARRRVQARFDIAGAVLLFVVLAGLSLFLKNASAAGGSPAFIAAGLALLALAIGFARLELRHKDPVFRPRFFLIRSFSAAAAAVALSNLAMYSTLLALPELLAREPGWTSERIGTTLLALSAGGVVCGPLGGWLADRVDRRTPVTIGLALFALALLPFAVTGALPPAAALVGLLAVAGVGLGLSGAGMQTSAVEAVSAREVGAASGVYSTSRYLGSIAGASLLPALLGPASGDARAVFLLIVPAAFLSVVASLGLRTASPTTSPQGEAG